MPSLVRPRQVVVLGRPTSVRLESAFWFRLRIIAAELGMTVRKFVEQIRIAYPHDPLSSTLRVQIANYFYSQMPIVGYVDPHSRRMFLVKKPGAGPRAAEAVRANPGKSDRVIAAELGVSKDTVRRARKAAASAR